MPEYTLKIRRFDPQSGRGRPLGRAHGRDARARNSVLDAILKVKGEADGSIGIRCSCQQGICGSCGVRMNGKPGLACNTHLEEAAARARGTGWNAADERRRRARHGDRGRADGQHAGDPRPDRRHGRGPLEEDPARHAVADQQASRCPSASTSSRTRTWSTSPRRWPASSAARACPTACRWRSTRGSSARRRSPRPTGSSATRVTPSSSERLKDLAEDEHGIYDCTHCFNCIDACPKGVAPMSQIMRLRRHRGLRPPDRGPQQRLPPRARVREEHPRQRAAARGRPAAATTAATRGSASSTRRRPRSCSSRCRRSSRR